MTHHVDQKEYSHQFAVEELWERIVSEMFDVYSQSVSMWFDLCKPILLTKHSLIVSADNDFVKMNISDRFQEELDKAATKIMGRPFTVHVVVSISE